MLHRFEADAPVVDTETDRADRALGFEPHERAAGTLHRLSEPPRLCLGPMGESIDIVDERDVDPIETQALQTVFDRAERAIMGIIEPLPERQHADIPVLISRRGGVWAQEPADLGRDHEALALDPAQRGADAMLAQTAAVVGRRIDVAHAELERALHGREGVLIADGCEEIAQRCRAETDPA